MKNVVKSIIFIIILLILVELTNYILMPKDVIRKYGIYQTAAYDILNEEDKTIDVIALGDSLIYSSVSPMQIWNESGITVYDCAIPAQIIEDCYKYLKVAIKAQQPKIVLMEANVLFRDSRKYKWYSKTAIEFEKIIPIKKYHNNWKIFFSNNELIDYNKGYKKITKVDPSTNFDYMTPTKKLRKLPKGNYEIFLKIVDLCKENNVELILISTPSQVSYNMPRKNRTAKIAQELNLEYLDLNENNPVGIDWTKETKDQGGHVNYLGARKVSKYLANYLKEKGIFEDRKENPKYQSWHEAYKLFKDN